MKKYLVALRSGGIMEDPEIRYSLAEIIEAEDAKEAENIYNTKNKCSYFYGEVLGEIVNGVVPIPVDTLICVLG